ncbi:hypothetical protein CIP101352_02186 [Corynebacterium diphtheriae]|nr:hypothetical protein CIP101352_02186 [Corynebacterium diphtheriae]
MTHPDHTNRQRLRNTAITRMQTGTTTKRVNRAPNSSKDTTRNRCIKDDVDVPHTSPRPQDYIQPLHTKIHEILIESGHTISHITAAAECSRTVVYTSMEKLATAGYQHSVSLISD